MSHAINSDDFKVYPNPSTGILSVELPFSDEDAEVTVVDVTGRVITKANVAANTNSPLTFNLSSAPKGVYAVKVTLEGETYISKVVIE